MANIITTQIIKDDIHESIIKVNILGDASGEEANTIIYDASAYNWPTTENNLQYIEYDLHGFGASLLWDATVNVPMLSLVENCQAEVDFRKTGGIPNNAGAGKTGDILLTTLGLATVAGDSGHIILRIKKNGSLRRAQ